MRAYVLIKADPGKAKIIARKLKQSKKVAESCLVTGPYDCIAVIEGKDVSEIGKIVVSNIQGLSGVRDTITCLQVDL